MSISIQTMHIYSAIVYLHHGTCSTFHSLTNDNICSFFFSNLKLLDPVLDGWLVYTHLLVGYPIMRKEKFLPSMSVHQSNLDCRLMHIFEPCDQNEWLLFIFTVLLQIQHWITLILLLPCDSFIKIRFQLCKHCKKLYKNYVNEIRWYSWTITHNNPQL